MDKYVIFVGLFLLAIFGMTFAAHLLYVEGYAFDIPGTEAPKDH